MFRRARGTHVLYEFDYYETSCQSKTLGQCKHLIKQPNIKHMIDSEDLKRWAEQSEDENRRELCEIFKENNEFAYKFAKKHPKYQDFMKHFINEEAWAHTWARDIGDHDFMKDKITTPESAYWWAKVFEQDENEMKQITKENGDEYWINHWNDEFLFNQID